ncbi:response regulator [Olivibacter sitiensis]|uniref:response regulator n=1 Tax=Olivibacter sitiensis TaxID=376470 RepID=UPI000428319A|nr:response regulator [Olivibacter sitiensis]
MKNEILLIDDSLITQILLKKVLDRDYQLIIKSNGEQALKWMKEGHTPGLIITDIVMPVMDGVHFIERLREDKMGVGVPIIALTSYYQELELDNLDIYGIVHKPIDIPSFNRMVRGAFALETLG